MACGLLEDLKRPDLQIHSMSLPIAAAARRQCMMALSAGHRSWPSAPKALQIRNQLGKAADGTVSRVHASARY
jgi:hypothetical protein